MGEYKLEHDRMAHASLLKSTIQGWSSPETDVYIISEEGHKIFTNRYFSYMVNQHLHNHSNDFNAGFS